MSRKLKINIDRARVSSEEIMSKRNFESVLAQAKSAPQKPFYRSNRFLFSALIIALLAAALLWTFSGTKEEEQAHTYPEVKEGTMTVKPDTEILPQSETEHVQQEIVTKDSIQPVKKNKTHAAFAGIKPGIPFTIYKINTSDTSSFTHKNGSVIEIPAMAFRTKKGKKAVSGNVEIHYREFRDAYDILIAGITMKYDSAGSTHQLRSAGMMEMRGYQNGEELEIIPGKAIRVKLATTIADPDYNVYKLNETTNRWKYVGRDSVSGGVNTFAREPFFNRDGTDDPGAPIKPVLPKQKNTQKKNFKLLVEPSSPWAMYNGMYFEIDEHQYTFNSSFYNIAWDKVNLKPSEDSTHYLFLFEKNGVFKKGFGEKGMSLTVEAYPVFDKGDSSTVMSLYRKQLKVREEYDKKIKEEQRNALNDQFRSYQLHGANTELIYRMFSIEGFGIWNCDKIYRLAQKQTINLSITDLTGVKLSIGSLHIINKNIRSVYYYDVEHGGYSSITIDPTAPNVFFAVTENGDIIYLSSRDFAALNLGQPTVQIRMKIRKNDFKDADALRVFLMEL